MKSLQKNKFFIVVVLCLVTLPTVFSVTQYLDIGNETLAITPQFLLADIKPNTSLTTVFKIYRSNYSSDSQLLLLNYTSTWNNISTNIYKEINQYTSAHTGKVEGLKENNALLFSWRNKTLRWDFNATQNNQNNTSTNQTNSSAPSFNQTPINNSPSFTVELSQHIFEVGQTLFMNFSVNPRPQNFTITYWIELLNGSIVKSPHTTTNLQTKQHTFQQPDFPQQPALLHAQYEDENYSFHKTALLAVHENTSLKEIQETPQVEQPLQTAFEIHDVLVEKNIVSFTAKLIKGESRSRIITLNLRDQRGYRLADEQKISLPQDNTQITIYGYFISDTAPVNATIDIEGLHKSVTHPVFIPSFAKYSSYNSTLMVSNDSIQEAFEPINSMYTRHSYFQEKIGWYIRLGGKGDFLVSIATSRNKSSYNISQQKTSTHQFTLWPANYNDTVLVKVCQQNRCVKKREFLNLSVRSSDVVSRQSPLLSQNISPLTARVADNTTSIHLHATSTQEQTSHLRITALVAGLCILIGAGSYFFKKRFKKK